MDEVGTAMMYCKKVAMMYCKKVPFEIHGYLTAKNGWQVGAGPAEMGVFFETRLSGYAVLCPKVGGRVHLPTWIRSYPLVVAP